MVGHFVLHLSSPTTVNSVNTLIPAKTLAYIDNNFYVCYLRLRHFVNNLEVFRIKIYLNPRKEEF